MGISSLNVTLCQDGLTRHILTQTYLDWPTGSVARSAG